MLDRHRECEAGEHYPRPIDVRGQIRCLIFHGRHDRRHTTAGTRESARLRKETTVQILVGEYVSDKDRKRWFECGEYLKQRGFQTTSLEICRSCPDR